jgi:four helix bundle protein
MDKIRTHKDLEVWKKGVDFVIEVYKTSEHFPKSEMYGLTNQIRRASVSIPADIAEGFGRSHTNELLQFLNISKGSVSEVETLLIICLRLNYLNQETFNTFNETIDHISRMLTNLIKSIKRNST